MNTRMISVMAFVLLFILIMTAFSQDFQSMPSQNTQPLQIRNKSLETRVAALEKKVAMLEKLIKDPPVQIIPCVK